MSPAVYGLLAAACVGVAMLAVAMLRQRGPLDHFTGPDGEVVVERPSALSQLVERLAARLGPGVAGAMGARRRRAIERRLDLAGHPAEMTVQRYIGVQAAITLLMAALFAWFSLLGASPLFILLGAIMGYVLTDTWLARTGRMRQERIERDLPDFLDILAVTVRAGLGYRLALQRVAESLGGPVGEEMTLVLRQMGLGAERRVAFQALRERNRSDTLDSFVAAQLQAEELGVPLADALNDIAADMRRLSHQNARRRAQRAAPRVSLIITSLIVPGSIILILVSLILGSGLQESGFLG